MDHVVYLDYKAKELTHLIAGNKTMIIRGAMGRKFPYGKLQNEETLYFIENNGDGMVKAKAVIADVFNSDQLTKEESVYLVEKYQDKLFLDKGMLRRFSGKRYIVLITIKKFEEIKPFKIDRSAYGNMDDWLPVENIKKVILE